MYKSASIILLLLLNIHTSAQNSLSASDRLFVRQCWGITLTPFLTTKANIQGDNNNYHLNSTPQFGAEVLLNYYYHFEKNYAIVFGFGGAVLAHNFNYDIPKEMFNPIAEGDISTNGAASREMDIFFFRAQAEIERRWHLTQKSNWVLGIGAALLFSIQNAEEASDIYMYQNGETKEFLYRNQDDNNHNKPWLNFHVSGGREWIVSRSSILGVQLKINYSPVQFVSGTYKFTTGVQPDVAGKYGVSGSYIGISLLYMFNHHN